MDLGHWWNSIDWLLIVQAFTAIAAVLSAWFARSAAQGSRDAAQEMVRARREEALARQLSTLGEIARFLGILRKEKDRHNAKTIIGALAGPLVAIDAELPICKQLLTAPEDDVEHLVASALVEVEATAKNIRTGSA